MYEQFKDTKHEALIEDENIDWISDVDPIVHGFIQKLLIEGLVLGNEMKVEIAKKAMQTSGTRGGRHVDRVLEAVKDQPEQMVQQDKLIDMGLKSDDEEPDKEPHTNRFRLG